MRLHGEGIVRGLLTPLRDFVYPPECAVCRTSTAATHLPLCGDCIARFQTLAPGITVWTELDAKLARGGKLDGLLSCYLFERRGPLRDALHRLKYGGRTSVAAWFGRVLGERMSASPAFRLADALIPVPLHRVKERERGFNQSELICRAASEAAGIPVVRALVRTRRTASQTGLALPGREANVLGAFALARKVRASAALRGSTCVVVDDIITTGATIAACARVLRADGGAARVLAASAALAAPWETDAAAAVP